MDPMDLMRLLARRRVPLGFACAAISLALARPTTTLWLHALGPELITAEVSAGGSVHQLAWTSPGDAELSFPGKKDYEAIYDKARWSRAGLPFDPIERSALAVSDEERRAAAANLSPSAIAAAYRRLREHPPEPERASESPPLRTLPGPRLSREALEAEQRDEDAIR